MTHASKLKVIQAREKKNEGFKHTSFEMETSTHFPLLMKVVNISKGTVLELGSGLFSTPLLHWMCYARDFFGSKAVPARKLITCESYKHYLKFAKKFETPTHEIRFVKDWATEELNEHYGVVFIDHSPKRPLTRGDAAIRFANNADYVVLHDAGENSHEKYGYEKAYKHFKYRYDWTGCVPHTTVLSNFHDLRNFYA